MENFACKNFGEFLEVVRKYAEAYEDFEKIQKCPDFDFVPIGDQKTGVIGEAFIFEYLKRHLCSADVKFGNHSQKGWDIKYSSSIGDVHVQIKTVSAFSKTRRISPIHFDFTQACCELYIVSLNKNLIPDYILKPKDFNPAKKRMFQNRGVVIGARMPKHENDETSGFTGLENIFEKFKELFPELYKNT